MNEYSMFQLLILGIYSVALIGIYFVIIKNIKQDLNKKSSKSSILILLGFITVFRYKVGIDYLNYIRIAEDFILTGDQTQIPTIGAPYILMLRVAKFFNNPYVFIWLTSLLSIFLLYLVQRKSKIGSKYIVAVFFLVGYFFAMNNQIRQIQGIMIFLLAMKYLVCQKYFKYYFLAMLSFIFHTGNLVVFIVPLIKIIVEKIKITNIGKIIIISIMFRFVSRSLFVFIVEYVDFFAQYKHMLVFGDTPRSIIYLIFLNITFYKAIKKISFEEVERDILIYFKISLIGLILFNISPGAISRGFLPLVTVNLYVFAYVLKQDKRFIKPLLTFLFAIMFINYSGVTPVHFWELFQRLGIL